MKIIITTVSLCFAISFSGCNQKQETKTETTQPATEKKVVEAIVIQPQIESDTLKGSLKALATGKIGNTVVTINYYSPAVRGRVIWGGLVPLEQVWVTGAHKANGKYHRNRSR
jgi:alpha-acetolactate decarboxylase